MKRMHDITDESEADTYDFDHANSETVNLATIRERVHSSISNNNLEELKKLHDEGNSLVNPIDSVGTRPLLLAAQFGFTDITHFIIQSQWDLMENDVLDACKALLSKFGTSGSMEDMNHISHLLQTWNKDHLPLTFVVIVQYAFKILRKMPIHLALFCETALQLKPSLSQDISLNLVLYEDTQCYWKILCDGVHLNDLWPINCEENPYSKYYTKHNLFDIYFNYGCLFTIHASGRNQITKMTIQAANGASSPAILYVIQNFPTDLYDDVFRLLILAGFKMSPTDVQRMANVEIDKASELVSWYKHFHSQPHKLKHLSRLAIRHNLRYNVAYSVNHLLLPRELYHYLLLNGVSDKEVKVCDN